jgi:hypothetical protein
MSLLLLGLRGTTMTMTSEVILARMGASGSPRSES